MENEHAVHGNQGMPLSTRNPVLYEATQLDKGHPVGFKESLFACRVYVKKVMETFDVRATYDLSFRPYRISLAVFVRVRLCFPCVLCCGISTYILPTLWLQSTLLCQSNVVLLFHAHHWKLLPVVLTQFDIIILDWYWQRALTDMCREAKWNLLSYNYKMSNGLW